MSTLPTGTVTFLFTDVEGSTRRWQDEPEAMRALLAEHDAILRDVIDKHRGHLFKHTGDGVAAVFGSAADACAAAVDAQARLRDVLPVRMGLHTGEAELRDGDYFGSTLNRCARLMGVAHGRQIVCSDATAGLVRDRDDLRDLGEHRLRDLSRAERVWQVGGGEFPALRSIDASPGNLPLQLSSFVGRGEDLAEVVDEVMEHRLVTLTGVGGVGKTRLALQAAAELVPRHAHGAWLVELAPVGDGDGVAAAVLMALALRQHQGKSVEQSVVDSLEARQVLVVLDNCEHLIGAVAQFVDRLLRACPQLRVLATSREGLGVRGERIMAVRSLSAGDGVALFAERAADASRSFVVDGENRLMIEQVCDRLDGIPLAIELAAARVRALGVAGVAAKLHDRFQLLRGGSRTAVERHQTLRATVDWSYRLLDGLDQHVLDRLSVFAGGFTLDAAEAVAADDQGDAAEVVDSLASLVDKSLVIAEPDGSGGVRYRLLEMIRQYAEERLGEDGDHAAVKAQHGAYFASLIEREGRRAKSRERMAAIAVLETELSNLYAAFDSAASAGDLDRAIRILSILDQSVLWSTRLGSTFAGWATPLLDHPGVAEHPERCWVLALGALHRVARGDIAAANQLSADAVAAPEPSSVLGELFRLDVRGLCASLAGDFEFALQLARARIELARRHALAHELAHSLSSYSGYLIMTDRVEEAGLAAEEAFSIGVRLGDPYLQAGPAYALAMWLSDRDPQRALEVATQGLATARAAQHHYLVALLLIPLAVLRDRPTHGDITAIRWVFDEHGDAHDHFSAEATIACFATYVFHLVDAEVGIRLAGASPLFTRNPAHARQLREPSIARLGQSATDRLLAEGAALSLAAALAEASELLARLEADLSQDAAAGSDPHHAE